MTAENDVKTLVADMDPENPDMDAIDRAAEVIHSGGIVAFPTETVYGLGASAFDASAVKKIFQAKDRPSDNPLIVHVSSIDMVEDVASHITAEGRELMERFWPGPLTIILPRSEKVPSIVTAGLDTVGVRMPEHPVALALIERSGPIAAPSANISGKPSPTQPEHVLADMRGRADMIITAGPCRVGVESTVIDLTTKVPCIYRPGRITVSDIAAVIGPVETSFRSSAPRSPGQKYRHYAPDTEMVVVPPCDGQRSTIKRILAEMVEAGKKVGLLCSLECARDFEEGGGVELFVFGSEERPEEALKALFMLLRDIDGRGLDMVVAQGMPDEGPYMAYMDRLTKAAGGNVVEC